jgi:thiol-disulfide isomerase/thioredoxin
MTIPLRLAASGVASLLTFGGVALLVAGDRSEAPAFAVAPAGARGAADLSLAPDLSFTDDSSSNFPIRGSNLSDGKIASDRPTAVFFGTSHCWNTNREAERFVALYRKHRDEARFVVVDLSSASSEQKPLVARLYKGFIPTLAFLDRSGKVVYNRAGETARERGDASALEAILRQAKSP